MSREVEKKVREAIDFIVDRVVKYLTQHKDANPENLKYACPIPELLLLISEERGQEHILNKFFENFDQIFEPRLLQRDERDILHFISPASNLYGALPSETASMLLALWELRKYEKIREKLSNKKNNIEELLDYLAEGLTNHSSDSDFYREIQKNPATRYLANLALLEWNQIYESERWKKVIENDLESINDEIEEIKFEKIKFEEKVKDKYIWNISDEYVWKISCYLLLLKKLNRSLTEDIVEFYTNIINKYISYKAKVISELISELKRKTKGVTSDEILRIFSTFITRKEKDKEIYSTHAPFILLLLLEFDKYELATKLAELIADIILTFKRPGGASDREKNIFNSFSYITYISLKTYLDYLERSKLLVHSQILINEVKQLLQKSDKVIIVTTEVTYNLFKVLKETSKVNKNKDITLITHQLEKVMSNDLKEIGYKVVKSNLGYNAILAVDIEKGLEVATFNLDLEKIRCRRLEKEEIRSILKALEVELGEKLKEKEEEIKYDIRERYLKELEKKFSELEYNDSYKPIHKAVEGKEDIKVVKLVHDYFINSPEVGDVQLAEALGIREVLDIRENICRYDVERFLGTKKIISRVYTNSELLKIIEGERLILEKIDKNIVFDDTAIIVFDNLSSEKLDQLFKGYVHRVYLPKNSKWLSNRIGDKYDEILNVNILGIEMEELDQKEKLEIKEKVERIAKKLGYKITDDQKNAIIYAIVKEYPLITNSLEVAKIVNEIAKDENLNWYTVLNLVRGVEHLDTLLIRVPIEKW